MGLATQLVSSSCPYCGEPVQLVVDDTSSNEDFLGEEQDYIEDCQVCCRPMQVSVRYAANGELEIALRDEND